MIVLNKLKSMTDKQIQEWLRKIHTENSINTLAIALLGTTDEIKACVFRNMSEHAKILLNGYIQEQRGNNLKKSEIQSNAKLIEKLL